MEDRLNPADDPKTLAEFRVEPDEVTQRRMRERQEDREERERLMRAEKLPNEDTVSPPVAEFLTSVEERAANWYRSGCKTHPREFALEVLEDVRGAGFKDPPSAARNSDVPDWKFRHERVKRLTPEQVAGYAGQARKALRDADIRVRAVDPVGDSSDVPCPYPDPQPVPVADGETWPTCHVHASPP